MKEVWIDLDDLVVNGKMYSISNYGQVWSKKTNRVLKQAKGLGGYPFVVFSQHSVKKQYDVHRLVALAFINKDNEEKTEVNHIDGNKENNKISNLEWVTPSANKKHAYALGLRKPLPASNMLKAIRSQCRAVAKIDESSGNVICVYQSANEAMKYEHDVARTTICYQCQNESKSTKNPFYFRYATVEQIAEAQKEGTYYAADYAHLEARS